MDYSRDSRVKFYALNDLPQPAMTRSKLIIETLDQSVKYVES